MTTGIVNTIIDNMVTVNIGGIIEDTLLGVFVLFALLMSLMIALGYVNQLIVRRK